MTKRLLAAVLMAVGTTASAAPVPREYFGLHIHAADAGTAWPGVPFGSWRLWDADVTWKDLEPQPGTWQFARLDRYVAMAGMTSTELLLPLALSPAWASSRPSEPSAYGAGHAAEPRQTGDWARYAETVATRYRGRIAAYEIWNEPNAEGFYSGDVASMVRLTCSARDAIRRADPAARLVSPSPTHGLAGVRWLEKYFAAGGARCVDVVGFHFYTQAHEPPEAMLPLVQAVREAMSRHGLAHLPLWNTESGWYLRNATRPLTVPWHALDTATAVGYVGRALVLGTALGLERFHWYAWDDGNLGLLELETGQPKASGRAYAAIADWITGASGLACAWNEPRMVRCTYEQGGRRWHVLWSRQGTVSFVPPPAWSVTASQTLLGPSRAIASGTAIEIGATPVRLETSP